MKKFYLLLGLVTSLFVSCSTDIVDEVVDSSNHSYVVNDAGHKITESEALDIANRFLKSTRSSSDFNVSYVLDKGKTLTRAVGVSDTLAYILNRADDNGFIVIATDDRVNPVLAFSEEGKFEYEESYDDIVYANFVSKIDDYMATIDENDTAVAVQYDILESCVSELPRAATSWSQFSPYDKYVIEEHPNCPVGCVAVACGQVMLYGKSSLEYHGEVYNFSSIRNALEKQEKELEGNVYSTRIVGPPAEISYDEAIDKVAKMLYWIGKDVHMSYHPVSDGGSAASSEDAYDLVKSLGYKLSTDGLTNFVDTTVMRHIVNGDIVYIKGTDINVVAGHAWIIDGGYFCWANEEKGVMNTPYLHCEWGWNGEHNGYYLGRVISVTDRYLFSVNGYRFTQLEYFAVGKN